MTIAITRSANLYTSAVTALWGALTAIAYHYQWLDSFTLMASLFSLFAAPLLGIMLFALYDKMFERFIYKSSRHLLLKNLHMKRLALVGIILGGLTLATNYALFPLAMFVNEPHHLLFRNTNRCRHMHIAVFHNAH